MAVVKINDNMREEIIKLINIDYIEYPTIKSFVDKAVKEKINILKRHNKMVAK